MAPVRNLGSVKIRSVIVGDSGQIAGLSTQLGYPVSAREMKKRIISVAKRPNQKLFAAVVAGQVVGWLEIFLPTSALNSGKAEIAALVVDKQYRRYGVGSALMEKAQQWARKKHSPFIYFRSNVIRSEAHEFYEQHGYERYKTQYIFRKIFTKGVAR